jgi:hypothetical protein
MQVWYCHAKDNRDVFESRRFGQPPALDTGEIRKFLDAGTEMQLKRNFRLTDVAGFLDRRRKLRQAFESVPSSIAKSLNGRNASDTGFETVVVFQRRAAGGTIGFGTTSQWSRTGRNRDWLMLWSFRRSIPQGTEYCMSRMGRSSIEDRREG